MPKQAPNFVATFFYGQAKSERLLAAKKGQAAEVPRAKALLAAKAPPRSESSIERKSAVSEWLDSMHLKEYLTVFDEAGVRRVQ